MATAQNWGPMGSENALGNLPVQRPFQEGSGQSYTTLDLTILSSNQIAIAAASGAVIAAGVRVLGYPDRNASGVQGSEVIVGLFQPGYVQRMPIYMGAAGNAVTALTDIGVAYGVRNDPVQGWCVSKDETVATMGRIIGIAADFPVGEPNGLVDFEWFTANEFGGGV